MKSDSVSAYVHMTRDTTVPLYTTVHILDEPPSMDGLFLNQKTNKNFRISYSPKYKHSKKKILYEKINGSVRWNKHSGEQY